MSNVRTIARNTSATLLAQLIVRILAFVFNVWVVRQLNETGMGRFSAALAFVAVFSVITDWGTNAYSLREMAREPHRSPQYVTDTIAVRTFFSLIALVALTYSTRFFPDSSYETIGILVASLTLVAYAYQGPLEAFLISQERLDLVGILLLVRQLTYMTVGFILVRANQGYIGLLIATVASILAMGVLSHFFANRWLDLRLTRLAPSRWGDLLRPAFPFAIGDATRVIGRRFDTVFMAFVLTDADVGWYNVPFGLVFMLLIIAQSLGRALYPTLVKTYASGKGDIAPTVQRAIRYLLLLALPIAIGGALLADRIIIVLYEENFTPSIRVLQILLFSLPFLFLSEILVRTANTIHKEADVARLGVWMMSMSIALNVILIPTIGITGAAAVFLIVRATRVFWLSRIIGLDLILGPDTNLGRTALPTLLMGIAILVASRLTTTPLMSQTTLLALVTLGGIIYLIATLGLQAITPQEQAYLRTTVGRRLQK